MQPPASGSSHFCFSASAGNMDAAQWQRCFRHCNLTLENSRAQCARPLPGLQSFFSRPYLYWHSFCGSTDSNSRALLSLSFCDIFGMHLLSGNPVFHERNHVPGSKGIHSPAATPCPALRLFSVSASCKANPPETYRDFICGHSGSGVFHRTGKNFGNHCPCAGRHNHSICILPVQPEKSARVSPDSNYGDEHRNVFDCQYR